MRINQKVKEEITEKEEVPEFIGKNKISLNFIFIIFVKLYLEVENCPPSFHIRVL